MSQQLMPPHHHHHGGDGEVVGENGINENHRSNKQATIVLLIPPRLTTSEKTQEGQNKQVREED